MRGVPVWLHGHLAQGELVVKKTHRVYRPGWPVSVRASRMQERDRGLPEGSLEPLEPSLGELSDWERPGIVLPRGERE